MTKLGKTRVGRVALPSILSVALAATVAFPVVAQAKPTAADKRAEAQAALASLNTMQKNLDEASNAHWAAVEKQKDAEKRMNEAQQRMDEANGKIGEVQVN